MKRLLATAAALLALCPLASSQDVSFSGVARYENSIPDWSFANSSFYTLLEGSFSEHFSYFVQNYWLNADPKNLYTGTLYSNSINWLNCATVTFEAGCFALELGKQGRLAGGMEYESDDFDCHYNLATTYWMAIPAYQWGATASFSTPSGMTTGQFQFSTSPYGERPFASGLYSYLVCFRGNYGPVELKWSAGGAQAPAEGSTKQFIHEITLGNKVTFGNLGITFDYFRILGNTFSLGAAYNFNDKFEICARGFYEDVNFDEAPYRDWLAGGYFYWFPLKDSRDLRIHVSGSYRNVFDSPEEGFKEHETVFTVGVTFNFNIFSFN